MPKPRRTDKASTSTARKAVKAEGRRSASRPRRPDTQSPAGDVIRRPTYNEAVRLYERGIEALQRHEFGRAAALLRDVIEQYPDERELLDRARLYLKVCVRHEQPVSAAPSTVSERVYAATLELNAGRPEAALDYLRSVVSEDPGNDHAFYMLAVACAQRQDVATVLAHLKKAIELNSENRSLALTDQEFDEFREVPAFRELLESGSGSPRRRLRNRTGR